MTCVYSSKTTRELMLRFILESIDYRKKCLYLQEIIGISKLNDIWRQALLAFFDTPMEIAPSKIFSTN